MTWARFVFVVLGLLGGLSIVEIALTVLDRLGSTTRGVVDSPKGLRYRTPDGKRIVPNVDVVIRRHPTSGRDIRVRTNGLGLRGADVPAKTSDELRVLVIGDSITFADSVEEHETFPSYLERELARTVPERPVRVLNAGGPNVGTLDEMRLLADLVPELRPDVVLVEFYLNDSREPAPYPEVLRASAWFPWRRVAERAGTAWSHTRYRSHHRDRYAWVPEFLERRWVTDREAYQRVIDLASPDWGAAWQEASWAPVEVGFRQMRALSVQYQFRLVAAAFPVSLQVESAVADDLPQRRLRDLLDRLDVPSVDVLPALRNTERSLFYDHCHLTPEGNARVARHLASFLPDMIQGRRREGIEGPD